MRITKGWICSVIVAAALVTGCGGGGGDTGGGGNTGGGGSMGSGAQNNTVVLTGVSGGSAIVSDATGASILVSNPTSPINGTIITIQPGQLGASSDTISVTYLDHLPGPLSSEALNAGVVIATPVISLTRASGASFTLPIEITIPYDKSTVGDDYPLVFYWDDVNQKYVSVKTLSVNRLAGTVTFQTNHFSDYLSTVIPGLVRYLRGNGPYPGILSSPNTNFSPAQDGFAARNFSTQVTAAVGGTCYGVVAYAQWYYARMKSRTGVGLSTIYNNGTAEPLDDDIARELMNRTFAETLDANRASFGKFRDVFSNVEAGRISVEELNIKAAADILTGLATGNGTPQIVGLFGNQIPSTTVLGHAVLAYDFKPGPLNSLSPAAFSIYDPNAPGASRTLEWNFNTSKFNPYGILSFVFHDSASSFNTDDRMKTYHDLALQGWPDSDRKFKEITLQPGANGSLNESPAGVNYPVHSPSTESLTFTWRRNPPSPPKSDVVPVKFDPSYLHIFINGAPSKVIEIADGGSATYTFDTITNPLPALPAELVAIVSGVRDDTSTVAQWVISNGYEGFLRVKLTLAPGITVPLQVTPLTEQYPVNFGVAAAGKGTIVSSTGEINCGVGGNTCGHGFPYDEAVSLTAVPDANSVFRGWSGACSGTGTCVVKMDRAKQVGAYFAFNWGVSIGITSQTCALAGTEFDAVLGQNVKVFSLTKSGHASAAVLGVLQDYIIIGTASNLTFECGEWSPWPSGVMPAGGCQRTSASQPQRTNWSASETTRIPESSLQTDAFASSIGVTRAFSSPSGIISIEQTVLLSDPIALGGGQSGYIRYEDFNISQCN